MKEEFIDFSFCDKKEKSIHNNLCSYMGVRTKTTCYCILDGKVCGPYHDYVNFDFSIKVLDEELEEINDIMMKIKQ